MINKYNINNIRHNTSIKLTMKVELPNYKTKHNSFTL